MHADVSVFKWFETVAFPQFSRQILLSNYWSPIGPNPNIVNSVQGEKERIGIGWV